MKEDPVLLVPSRNLESEILERLELGEDLLDREVESLEAVTLLERDFTTWDEVNMEILRCRFSNANIAEQYEAKGIRFVGRGTLFQELQMLHSRVEGQCRKLNSIQQRLPYLKTDDSVQAQAPIVSRPQGNKVFVVHGHDGEIKYQLVEFIELITHERPVVLHERADKGRTIIEKFEDHASEIGFAVIILTADDVGGLRGQKDLKPRARQNVVFEHGFFIGSIGRDRVLALCEVGVERPSDLDGILYKELEGNWKLELATELKAAGIRVDGSKLF